MHCHSVVDCGTQPGNYLGNVTELRKIMIQFECQAPDGSKFNYSQIFTASTNPMSTLRKNLDAWNGEPFTREAIKNIGPDWMLGRSGLLTLDHANDYDERLTIKAIAPIGDVMIPASTHPIVYFNLESPDLAVFSKLTPGVQAMIQKSPEWKALPYADDWVRHYVSQQTSGNAPF